MDHLELAHMLAALTTADRAPDVAPHIDALARSLRDLVDIRTTRMPVDDGDGATMGYGILRFEERVFYSVKIGNARRNRLGASTLAGSVVTGAATLAAIIELGRFDDWPGAGAAVAIALAFAGKLKPFVADLGFDDATALALAWDHMRIDNGFRLVDLGDIIANIDEAHTRYRHHSFSEGKLRDAIGKLLPLGMVRPVSGDCYQLVETVRISGTEQLAIEPG